MDPNVKSYYSSNPDGSNSGQFFQVIPLDESSSYTWKQLQELCPKLPRGWFELTKLPPTDRIDFLHAYWLKKLPFQPELKKALDLFFDHLDNILVYLIQKTANSPLTANLVYSMSNGRSFFHGNPPADPKQLEELQALFDEFHLPKDYLNFLSVHNGFAKTIDTGILPCEEVKNSTEKVRRIMASQRDPLVDSKGNLLDPKSFISFYESFSLPCFQCFRTDWYPQEEMGNIYYSGIEGTISSCNPKGNWSEELSFPSFLDWLLFYLEGIA